MNVETCLLRNNLRFHPAEMHQKKVNLIGAHANKSKAQLVQLQKDLTNVNQKNGIARNNLATRQIPVNISAVKKAIKQHESLVNKLIHEQLDVSQEIKNLSSKSNASDKHKISEIHKCFQKINNLVIEIDSLLGKAYGTNIPKNQLTDNISVLLHIKDENRASLENHVIVEFLNDLIENAADAQAKISQNSQDVKLVKAFRNEFEAMKDQLKQVEDFINTSKSCAPELAAGCQVLRAVVAENQKIFDKLQSKPPKNKHPIDENNGEIALQARLNKEPIQNSSLASVDNFNNSTHIDAMKLPISPNLPVELPTDLSTALSSSLSTTLSTSLSTSVPISKSTHRNTSISTLVSNQLERSALDLTAKDQDGLVASMLDMWKQDDRDDAKARNKFAMSFLPGSDGDRNIDNNDDDLDLARSILTERNQDALADINDEDFERSLIISDLKGDNGKDHSQFFASTSTSSLLASDTGTSTNSNFASMTPQEDVATMMNDLYNQVHSIGSDSIGSDSIGSFGSLSRSSLLLQPVNFQVAELEFEAFTQKLAEEVELYCGMISDVIIANGPISDLETIESNLNEIEAEWVEFNLMPRRMPSSLSSLIKKARIDINLYRSMNSALNNSTASISIDDSEVPLESDATDWMSEFESLLQGKRGFVNSQGSSLSNSTASINIDDADDAAFDLIDDASEISEVESVPQQPFVDLEELRREREAFANQLLGLVTTCSEKIVDVITNDGDASDLESCEAFLTKIESAWLDFRQEDWLTRMPSDLSLAIKQARTVIEQYRECENK